MILVESLKFFIKNPKLWVIKTKQKNAPKFSFLVKKFNFLYSGKK